jgi:hypothetical protein
MGGFNVAPRDFRGDVSVDGDVDATGLQTENINGDRLYSGSFQGTTPDDRLDSALIQATQGDTVKLESADYSKDRTGTDAIQKTVSLESGTPANSAIIKDGTTWEITNAHVIIKSVEIRGTVEILGFNSTVETCSGFTGQQTINVNADAVRIFGCSSFTVNFNSGTSSGVVDVCSNMNITDNGSNTIGDIA